MPLRVAIIGAGPAGRTFAAACATTGHTVVLEDILPANLRHAEQVFASLGQQVELVLTVEDAVRHADIAIDFVPDELESKLEIFSLLDRMAPPRTILCTPSETLSITDLASCTYRSDRCIMLRNLTPAGPETSLILLLTNRHTSLETQVRTEELVRTLGRIPRLEPDPDLPMLIKNMNLPSGSLL